jgi:alpha-D-ribose 1-methylphosphonate 5-triphosphate synthase subunit PhnI
MNMKETQRNGAMPLDGNAEGGLLSELFALDVTAAEITCSGCGVVAAIGEIRVYASTMGAVFRCAHCDTVVMRLTRTPAGLFLDMHGARRLFVAAPEV